MAEPDARLAVEKRRDASGHAAAGRWTECRNAALRGLLLIPGDAIAAYFLGLASAGLAEPAASARHARHSAVAIGRKQPVPLHRELFALLGLALDDKAALLRAVLLTPGDGSGLFNLANKDIRSENYGAARTLLRRADIVRPLDPPTLSSAARLKGLICDDPDGGIAFRRALVLAPGNFSTLRNMGLRYRKKDAPAPGARWFRRAVAVNPTSREAQGELGRALLTDGKLEEGWSRLERFRLPEWAPPIEGLPRWEGRPLKDGALLLWSMDKIGDELLFSCFLERVREIAGEIVVVVDSRNIELLSRLHPEIEFRDCVPRTGSFSAAYPLDFIGRFLSRTPAEMTPSAGARVISARQPRTGPLRVGISWKSDASLVGELKSTALDDWKTLLRRPNCRFFSLQYGEVDEELERLPNIQKIPGFDPFGTTLAFAETVASLDLVITVANTTAHVAAHTATPFWVLLPRGFGCSWFWFRDRADSPIYPGARLFRQSDPGDWRPVFEEVGGALDVFAAELRCPG